MVDITNKINTKREAVAQAIVKTSSKKTIGAIKNNLVPKGNVFEFARAAGLLALKKTSDVIPDCHPLPVEFAKISYEIKNLDIIITVEAATIYKTGLEVEAMHGAMISALCLYDMLKPIDKNLIIGDIKLLSKKGGKTDFNKIFLKTLKIAVVVCSDTISKNQKADVAGKKIISYLEKFEIDVKNYTIIPDDKIEIEKQLSMLLKKKMDIILFCGGTGLSPRDITPETILPLLHREIPGIMEAARSFGQEKTPYAMLSRGIAGMINNSLIITLPGSTKGAAETMQALFPFVFHIFEVSKGQRHK